MAIAQEEIKEAILKYIKSSWDKTLSEETKIAFLALAVPDKQVPVNTLTFDTRIDRNKISISLAALEALQLISQTKLGVSKFCELTNLGWIFAEKFNLKGEKLNGPQY